jgi:Contractile injection system tube protein
VPEPPNLKKAHIREIWFGPNGAIREENPKGAPAKAFDVQFNPHTLKLSYATQKENADAPNGSPTQFVGEATTKLTMELVFDATQPVGAGGDRADDVRTLTQRIAYFLIPQSSGTPPGLRFQWGSTLFEGVLDSMDETIDLFDEEGRPLRATVAVAMTQQKITFDPNKQVGAGGGLGVAAAGSGGLPGIGGALGGVRIPGAGMPTVPGTVALAQARGGESLAQLAGRAGIADWRAAATLNDIDNPRQLATGALLALPRRVGL